MTAATAQPRPCSVARTLDIVGEKWALLAMREVFLGNRKFDEMIRRTGAPRDTLAVKIFKQRNGVFARDAGQVLERTDINLRAALSLEALQRRRVGGHFEVRIAAPGLHRLSGARPPDDGDTAISREEEEVRLLGREREQELVVEHALRHERLVEERPGERGDLVLSDGPDGRLRIGVAHPSRELVDGADRVRARHNLSRVGGRARLAVLPGTRSAIGRKFRTERRRLEEQLIPETINYQDVPHLRTQARQKLTLTRPRTVGQASRVEGVTPADLAILMVYLEKQRAMEIHS